MLKKYYLGGFFWTPIPHKWYQNMSGFAGVFCNLINKETLAQVFSYEFYEISKNNIFTQHLWATASEEHLRIAASAFLETVHNF